MQEKKVNIKIGDKLYCHTDLIMKGCSRKKLNRGDYYEIINIITEEYELVIFNNDGDPHYFGMINYRNWLFNMKEARKLKLEKIKKI